MSSQTMSASASRMEKVRAWVRANGVRAGLEAAFNFAAPFLVYNYSHHALGDVKALIASSGPPIAWSLIEFARHRRADALSLLVLGGIALSLLAFLGGGGAKFLQLRENLVGGLIALLFLGSAAIRRPLIYQLARATIRRRGGQDLGEFEARRDDIHFRRAMTFMTLVWGFGLLAQTAIACVLVFSLTIHDYLLVSPIVGYGVTGGLFAWTFWWSARARRRGDARRAAEAAAALADGGSEPA